MICVQQRHRAHSEIRQSVKTFHLNPSHSGFGRREWIIRRQQCCRAPQQQQMRAIHDFICVVRGSGLFLMHT